MYFISQLFLFIALGTDAVDLFDMFVGLEIVLSADAMLAFDDLRAMVFCDPAAQPADQMAVAVGLINNFITFPWFGFTALRHRSNDTGFFDDFKGSVDSRSGNALWSSAECLDQLFRLEMNSGRLSENCVENDETFVTDVFFMVSEIDSQVSGSNFLIHFKDFP